jgi:thioesterase domain-containing protein
VIAFVCHTLGPRRWQRTSISELAAEYARFIAERSIEQGCAVVGWSFGGDLAVETVRQLRGRVAVRFLGVVDVVDRHDILALGAPDGLGNERPSSDVTPSCQRILDWMQASAMRAHWQQLLADMNPLERAATLQFMAADPRPLPTDGPALDSKEYDKWVLTRLSWMRWRHSREAEHALEVGLHSWRAEATARDPRYRQRAWGERVSVHPQQMIAGTTHKSILEHPQFIAAVRTALHAADGTGRMSHQ